MSEGKTYDLAVIGSGTACALRLGSEEAADQRCRRMRGHALALRKPFR
jgi:hypothetical protein